jgi:hypothetical protein
MAIPSYAYLKLKISRSANIIIVEAKVQWALDYEQNNIKLAIAAVAAIELKELRRNAQPYLANPTMPSSTYTFKAVRTPRLSKSMQRTYLRPSRLGPV